MSKKKFVKRPLKIFIPKILDRVNSFFSKSDLIYLSSNYLYLDIPKSASSFIKSTIINSSNLSISCGAEYPHSSVFKRPKPYENINRFKIYSFIRDPIDRFCSVIREKFNISNDFVKTEWSPYSQLLKYKRYKLDNLEKMVLDFVKCPDLIIDKHLLPQAYYLEKYYKSGKLFIYRTNDIKKKLPELMSGPLIFPNKKIALKTDKNLFNEDHLSKKSLLKLKEYYKKDYIFLEKISENGIQL
tara:strand:+ start:98 stop:823 length:726 start_codon:yes stop_codon:yes gene_type:complete